MTQFFNKTAEKEKRRALRKKMPAAETAIWSKLRNNQLYGHKFRRQYSVGPYMIDFYCPALRLAVEIDGDSHFTADAGRYDESRQTFIQSFGIHFLRFTNEELYQNLDGVLDEITRVAQGENSKAG